MVANHCAMLQLQRKRRIEVSSVFLKFLRGLEDAYCKQIMVRWFRAKGVFAISKSATYFQAPKVNAAQQKKTPARSGRQVIEAGFIQARNLSSSDPVILNNLTLSKLKV
ncbi:hypothetical protein A9Q94_10730 [Rhodobacterales bacterium 56_14_T64]|nr:hypothetical protein A9Q94_10730 [Rhodobacterales bacterium 56_14_T64]